MGTPELEAEVSVSLEERAVRGWEAPEAMGQGIRAILLPLCRRRRTLAERDSRHRGASYIFMLPPASHHARKKLSVVTVKYLDSSKNIKNKVIFWCLS